jgi:hypothetical protein
MGLIIPSGSLESSSIVGVPDWARPTAWWGIEIGCLARVLPLAGPEWCNELVIILHEEARSPRGAQQYRVIGRKGTIILPYYALSVEEYHLCP